MFADMRSSSETIWSFSDPASRRVTSSTPTLRPLQVSGSAAAAPTCASDAPSRQASERASLRKSLLILSLWPRKACPQTPEPSGVLATIEISIRRRRLMSSPMPAANRSMSVPDSSKKTAVARKSPLENAASQTFRYNSSGDFAYRIASLVAFNAANVRAIVVFKALELPAGDSGLPRDFMNGRRLNGRYWQPEVAIQSKCPTNFAGPLSEELRFR